jgi:hypothetical protein
MLQFGPRCFDFELVCCTVYTFSGLKDLSKRILCAFTVTKSLTRVDYEIETLVVKCLVVCVTNLLDHLVVLAESWSQR